MKALLFYDNGDEFESDFQVRKFDSKELMIDFINNEGVGKGVISAYEFYTELEIEPFEKVLSYKIKDE